MDNNYNAFYAYSYDYSSGTCSYASITECSPNNEDTGNDYVIRLRSNVTYNNNNLSYSHITGYDNLDIVYPKSGSSELSFNTLYENTGYYILYIWGASPNHEFTLTQWNIVSNHQRPGNSDHLLYHWYATVHYKDCIFNDNDHSYFAGGYYSTVDYPSTTFYGNSCTDNIGSKRTVYNHEWMSVECIVDFIQLYMNEREENAYLKHSIEDMVHQKIDRYESFIDTLLHSWSEY